MGANFPEAYEEAFIAAQDIQSESTRAHALIALGANFPEAYKEIFTVAQESYSVHTLETIAANLPQEFYKEACTAALIIDLQFMRTDVLSNLILRFSNLSISKQFTIWQTILQIGSQRKRPEFLSDLAASIPLVDSLGGNVTGGAIAGVIQQVTRWWR